MELCQGRLEPRGSGGREEEGGGQYIKGILPSKKYGFTDPSPPPPPPFPLASLKGNSIVAFLAVYL